MKTKLFVRVMPVGLALLIGLSSPAFSSGRDGGCQAKGNWQEKKEKGFDKIMQGMNLTDEQKKTLDAQRQKHRQAAEAVFTQVQEKSKLLRTEMEADNPDRQKLDALINEISGLKGQLMKQRIDGILEVRAVLTPEQYKQLKQKMEERRKKMSEKRGHKGGGKWGGSHEGGIMHEGL